MKKAKLTKAQARKFGIIDRYLKDKETRSYIFLYINDVTYAVDIRGIEVSGGGFKIKVNDNLYDGTGRKLKTEEIEPEEMNKLFTAMKKGDEDFLNYLETNNLK